MNSIISQVKISADKSNQSIRADVCHSSPLTRQESGGVGSRPLPCNFLMDDVLDCIRLYPRYLGYFQEKLGKIGRLQTLINNRHLRARGETKEFLRHWIKYFSRQAGNTCEWLLRKGQ